MNTPSRWFGMSASCAGLSLAMLMAAFSAPHPAGSLIAGRSARTHATKSAASAHKHAVKSAPRATPSHATTHASAKHATKADRTKVFRGLGAWVDVFDRGAIGVHRTVAVMKRNGVRTLYLQTATSFSDRAIAAWAGGWLVNAHRAGIKVVGWYVPSYDHPKADIARTVAIAKFRYHGHRFDGLGVDIEERRFVKHATWNRRVASEMSTVRKRVGPNYPVAAIPPTPLQMRVAPHYWAGFPWKRVAAQSDAIMLMSYWSDRAGCPRIALYCAGNFTKYNVWLTRRLVGSHRVAVHIIGGVGDRITARGLRSFVAAARAAHADGASIYDVATTHPGWWPLLKRLKGLGL